MTYSSRNDIPITEKELGFDNIFDLLPYQAEILEVCDDFNIRALDIRNAFTTIEELLTENERLLERVEELEKEQNNG